MDDLTTLVLQGLQIIWINVLLSADNAVVIALAVRGLDRGKRKWAVLGGSLAAVALRIIFTIFIVALLRLPYVKLASGLLLFWIAFGLLRKHDGDKDVARSSSIWGAVRTIAIADAIMSLDNVVAVAAAAKNSLPMIVFGIGLSVPLIVFGSTLMLRLLRRFPILVVAGAALLGWVAGEIMMGDPTFAALLGRLGAAIAAMTPRLLAWIGSRPDHAEVIAGASGAALLLVTAWLLRRRRAPIASLPREHSVAPASSGLDRHDGAGVGRASFHSGTEKTVRYLHTMVRVENIESALDFWCDKLGLEEIRRIENEKGRFTLIFLAAPDDAGRSKSERSPEVELTYNWDPETYKEGRNFGHLAYEVDDIYAICDKLMKAGVTINRPPRDGNMAFVRSPGNISIELLQKGPAKAPAEPWKSMENTGTW